MNTPNHDRPVSVTGEAKNLADVIGRLREKAAILVARDNRCDDGRALDRAADVLEDALADIVEQGLDVVEQSVVVSDDTSDPGYWHDAQAHHDSIAQRGEAEGGPEARPAGLLSRIPSTDEGTNS